MGDEYAKTAKQILALPNPKAGHGNWEYDDPRLRSAGMTINGRNDNTRWVWHPLQPDLPAHLQFAASFYGMDFPWKHLSGSQPEFYGAADVDAVQRIMSSALNDLERRGIPQFL